MSKKRFAGLLLLSTGLILTVLGFGLGIPDLGEINKQKQNNVEIEKKMLPSTEDILIINLPGPDTIVASPLLVRGKIYGDADQVELRLTDANQGILATLDIKVEENVDNKEYKLIQTSLIFDQPARQSGLLNAQLKNKGQKVDEANIPVIFR